MSCMCNECIHDYVCGLEDNHEEGLISCDDCIPKNIFDKIKAEIEKTSNKEWKHDEKWATGLRYAVKIIDKYKDKERNLRLRRIRNETDY